MKECGFENAQVIRHTIEVPNVEVEKWFSMLRARFWSTFSLCTDQEIESGIQELRQKYQGTTFTVYDPMIFITAEKP